MRKVLMVTAAMAIGATLLSCTAPQRPIADAPSAPPMSYEPLAPVARTPLSPPVGYVGYASPPRLTNSPTSLAPYGNSLDEGAEPQTAAHGVWRASPRWAAVKGEGCIVVGQDQAKATKVTVDNCSKADIDAVAQLKEPRSY